LVSGLWHGANWTFVVWGVLHGFFQIIEKLFVGNKIKVELKQGKIRLTWCRILRIVVTFNLVSLAWIFFRMPTIGDAIAIINRIFTNFDRFSIEPMVPLYGVCIALCLPLLLFKDIRDEYLPNILNHRVLKWAFYVIIASFTICLGSLDAGQFIYVNF